MSGFEFNKLMAAFLTAALFAMVVGVISDMVYEPEHLEKNAYAIEGVATDAAAEAPKEVPFEVALASADPKAGAKVFARCTACHDDSKGGPNKVGPELWSVVGRPVASADPPGVWEGRPSFWEAGVARRVSRGPVRSVMRRTGSRNPALR